MLLKLAVILLLWIYSYTLLLSFVCAQETIVAPTQTIKAQTSTAVFSNNSNHLLNKNLNIGEVDTEVVEAHILPNEFGSTQATFLNSERKGRQFFYHPAIAFLPTYAEGSKCITRHGFTGFCVSFGSCHHYYRYRRQLMFIPVRQWPQPATMNQEFCTFYDRLRQPNNGICCTNELEDDGIEFGLLPVQPIRPPVIIEPERPAQEVPPLPMPPHRPTSPDMPIAGDGNAAADDDNIETLGNNNDSEEVTASKPHKFGDSTEHIAIADTDFPDINNVAYDPINEEGDELPIPVTYDDYRYQWPIQQFTGVQQQWPPALPTHPPTVAASWPPPIPTHPPGHHYPTHPPTQTHPTNSLIATKKTTMTPTTSHRPTTTHRPSYPNYPIYRPSTPRPRPPTTTTTTRQPTISSGTSPYGLPLQCGIKNPASPDQERIVGGTSASPNEFPWIAVLFKAGKQFCGGSLITKSHILTAAHCVARMTSWDVASLTVHLGDYDIRNNYEVKHIERRIKRLVRHKGFDFSTLHNDIAILTIHEPVKFTYEIQPICLPTSSDQLSRSYSGKVATVAGWGSLRENGPQPSILQKVEIPIWTNSECARKYGRAAPGGIISSMICAGRASRDSCSGDSGGPMILNENDRYTQIGIVSWGIGCGKGRYPGVYTRVTSLLPWIYKNIKT